MGKRIRVYDSNVNGVRLYLSYSVLIIILPYRYHNHLLSIPYRDNELKVPERSLWMKIILCKDSPIHP